MASKNVRKRKPGRPRKPNRTYSGPLPVKQIRDWSMYADTVVHLLKTQVDRLEAAGIRDVWVFGREITSGLDRLDQWVSKLEASVSQAIRRKEAGMDSLEEEQERDESADECRCPA